jgi:hypothetical protein
MFTLAGTLKLHCGQLGRGGEGGGGARTLGHGHLHVPSLHSLPHKLGQHVWADPGTMCLQLIRHVVETIPNRVLHMPRLP